MLTDPRKNDEPFYIGKGQGRRAYAHGNETRQYNSFKENVINAIIEAGGKHGVEIIEWFETEDEAYSKEIYLIEKYGRRDIDENGILVNRVLGGGGVTGRVVSDETRKKISEAHRGKTRRSGYRLTDDHKKKISESHKGKVCDTSHLQTQEIVQKRADSLRGYKHTVETRARMSESHLGKDLSEEHKRNIAKSLTGITRSKTQRKKISDSKKGDKNPMYGKKWYTDGKKAKQYTPGEEPKGFKPGRKVE
jgi:hypothetical protein